jgi:biopolymer transport protein ExbB/TolQ
LERWWFYREANRDLETFRNKIKSATQSGNLEQAFIAAKSRYELKNATTPDFEAAMTFSVLEVATKTLTKGTADFESIQTSSMDRMLTTKLAWEKRLAVLATIGANAPFVGLFGTVLGIIQAFHNLSNNMSGGPQTVTAGISEALIATAVGILVAIPAVVAFNLFQRKVRESIMEAEALKNFIMTQLRKS